MSEKYSLASLAVEVPKPIKPTNKSLNDTHNDKSSSIGPIALSLQSLTVTSAFQVQG